MKTFRSIREGSLDDKLDKYVSDEIKKRKLARFPVNATDFQLWHMAERKVDRKTMSLMIKDYMDGMEKVIKKNIDTFSSAMLSYAKKRETETSWDEQVVNNFKVKTAHFFKLKLLDGKNSLTPEQDELMQFAKSQGWKVKMWDAPIELEVYTREVAKKELGK